MVARRHLVAWHFSSLLLFHHDSKKLVLHWQQFFNQFNDENRQPTSFQPLNKFLIGIQFKRMASPYFQNNII
jgi:hypothetical protein